MVLKRKIEDRSITALQAVIDAHPTMEGYIKKRDKELAWDGYIRLYQNDNSADDKANYDDDVPVQIKGHVDKDRQHMGKERVTASVDLEDLRVYYRKTGCLYFVMYMTEDGSEVEIFYSSLYPSKIKSYLETAARKGNKESISIPFLKLAQDSRSLYLLCKQFSFEIQKQGSGRGQIVPRSIKGETLRQVKKITATTVGGKTPYDLLKRVNSGDVVFYGTIDNSGIQYPIQMNQMAASVKQVVNAPVFVGDKQYYSSFEDETAMMGPDVKDFSREETHIVRPSQNVTLTFKKSEGIFKYQFVTDIMQLKKDAEFILDLLNKKELTVFGEKNKMEIGKVDAEFLAQLQGIIEAGNVLEEIGCNILIPFKELTDNDKSQIDFLCSIKAGHIHFNTDKKVFLYTWEFRKKRWPVLVDISGDEVKLYGYVFNTDFQFSIGSPDGEKAHERLPEGAYIVPNFLRMEPELLANLYWYDYESMYEQIDRAVVNGETADELNGLALNLITAYDLSGNEKLLDVADEVLRRLEEVFPDAVHYIVNSCQIEVRKTGVLSEASRLRLYELEEIGGSDSEEGRGDAGRIFHYCATVLRGEVDAADEIYETLTEADRKGVDEWPIRKLHLMRRAFLVRGKE